MADEQDENVENIINSIISYLNFLNDFKKVKEDYSINIENKNDESKKHCYTFREFNVETYIINNEFFDEFKNAINFDQLTAILDPITEENKKKAIEELKKYLNKNPFNLNDNNLKIFSELQEMKEVIKNINNISFINEDILCNGMGINEDILEGKKFKVSKNKNDICLISLSKNFTLNIKTNKKNIEVNKENEIKKEFKNLYYVEDLTKKIFILLYINEQRLKYKFKKKISNHYKFKKYYLINKDWLEKYKKFFLYDFVIKKFKDEYNKEYNDNNKKNIKNNNKENIKNINDKNIDIQNNNNDNDNDKQNINNDNHKQYNNNNEQNINNNDKQNNNINEVEDNLLYENIIFNLDEIIQSIGQIILYSSTQVEDDIRDFTKIIPKNLKTKIQTKVLKKELMQVTEEVELVDNYITTPSKFYLINDDILELLKKEEFFFNINEEVIIKIEYHILLGNDKMIIRNKASDNNDSKFNYTNEYLFYIDKEEKEKYLEDEEVRDTELYVLYYILNYSKNKSFFNDLKILNKQNGLYEYIIIKNKNKKNNNNIDLNNIKKEEFIKDEIGNIIGSFINIRINKDSIKNENILINYVYEKRNEINFEIKNNNNNKIIKNDFIDEEIIENLDEEGYNPNENKIIESNNKNNINEQNNEELNNSNNNVNNYFENKNDINENKTNHNEINDEMDKKDKIKFIIKFFKENRIDEISKILDDINIQDLDVSILNPDNIEKKLTDTNSIFLIDKEKLEKFKSFLCYDKICEYSKLKKQEKKIFIEKNTDELFELCNRIKNRNYILEKIKLIINYNDYEKESISNNHFCILDKTKKYIRKFYRKFDEDLIYFLRFKNELYIYFRDKKEICKLKKVDNTFNELINTKNKEKMCYSDILNIINVIINKNKKEEQIKKYLNLYYKDFKEFYLINEKWLYKQINNNKEINVESIKPTFYNTSFNYKYPVNFGIIEKGEQELINQLIKNNASINIEDLYLTKIFFVNGRKNFNSKKIYIGLFNNNDNLIYFYLFGNQDYSIEFLLEYINHDKLFYEINEQILKKGIEAYIYDLGVYFSKKEKKDLIINNNNEFEQIGFFYDLNKKRKINQIYNSRALDNIQDFYYYNGVIQCLVNIEPLKNIFLNRKILMDKKIKLKNKNVLNNFYNLIQYMWKINDNDNNETDNVNQGTIFFIEIKTLLNDFYIFKNIRLLIEFLLLSMNLEHVLVNNDNNTINYKIDYLRLTALDNNKSFIKELFFFEIKSKCCKENNYLSYLLSFNGEQLYKQFKNNKINIESILSSGKAEITCQKCYKIKESQFKFVKFPEVLIIVIQYKKEDYTLNSLNLYLMETMKIKNIKKEIQEYKLISMIIKKENKIETYCKPFMENNLWNEYLEEDKEQKIIYYKSFNEIFKDKNNPVNPCLLIFQKLN